MWWKIYNNILSHFHRIPELNGRTDGRTDGQIDRQICYRASVCWRALKSWRAIHFTILLRKPRLVDFYEFRYVAKFIRLTKILTIDSGVRVLTRYIHYHHHHHLYFASKLVCCRYKDKRSSIFLAVCDWSIDPLCFSGSGDTLLYGVGIEQSATHRQLRQNSATIGNTR